MQGDLNGMWHVPIPNLLILNSGPLQDLNMSLRTCDTLNLKAEHP